MTDRHPPSHTYAQASIGAAVTIGGKSYVVEESLRAEGGVSEVWKVKSQANGDSAVLKRCHSKEGYEQETSVRESVGRSSRDVLLELIAQDAPERLILLELGTETLRQKLESGPLDEVLEEGVVKMVSKHVLKGIKALHDRKLVHLDVKPDNIMGVTKAGTTAVTWKLFDLDDCREIGKSVAGFTPNYAAPELAQAKLQGREVSASKAMDIWAFGAVVYEMATGEVLIPQTGEAALALLGAPSEQIKSHILNAFTCLQNGRFGKQANLLNLVNAMLQPESTRADVHKLSGMGFIAGSLTTVVDQIIDKRFGGLTQMIYEVQEEVKHVAKTLEEMKEQLTSIDAGLTSLIEHDDNGAS